MFGNSYFTEGDGDDDDDDGEKPAFGGPKPMLPYSSMFVFGPTNPYVAHVTLIYQSKLLLN